MDSDWQALPALLFYLLLAFILTARICYTLYKQSKQLQPQEWQATRPYVILFALLAISSLGATWYYMLSFFAYSYHNWACQAGLLADATAVDLETLEMWLKDTELFKQAWETVVETPQRFWWSGQIFLWATGWSLFLGLMGNRFNISHVWVYMLLGQIVAISFAQNMFHLSIMLSSPSALSKRDAVSAFWTPIFILEVLPLLISFLSTPVVTYVVHTPYFLPVLLIPHLLLFIPATLSPNRLPSRLRATYRDSAAVTKRYVSIFKWLAIMALLLQAQSTYAAFTSTAPAPLRRAEQGCGFEMSQDTRFRSPWKRLANTMFEHPAVSSVSWDVVFCLVSSMAWAAISAFDARSMLEVRSLSSKKGVKSQTPRRA